MARLVGYGAKNAPNPPYININVLCWSGPVKPNTNYAVLPLT